MRAATYQRTGPAHEVLAITEVPTPEPGPGEVRVKMVWSGVNPSDVKTRAGLRSKTLPFPLIIPHSDGSGVIDRVGPKVSSRRIGESVWVWNATWQRPFGTAAQYVVLPAQQAVPLPAGTDLAAGACLGIPALTAYHATHVDGGVAGKAVLVAGGAGAVGHYAIQFAKLAGAGPILATASSSEKSELAREAGADAVFNYKSGHLTAEIQEFTLGQGVDRIIEVDLASNIELDLPILKPEGDIIAYGSSQAEIPVPFFPMILKNLRLRFFIVYNLSQKDRERAIKDLSRMLKDGDLSHNISVRLPLEKIAEAHELIERGQLTGNAIIGMD
jgi:NADPH2:quinone reductase